MSFIYSVFGFLIAIAILVAVHEFGHFWVARKLGVKVLRFSVGFGKPLWKKVAGDDQIEYVIGAIPLGGYVKMLGEGGGETIPASERHRAFDNQPIWKRSLIVIAGPAINFLFAILIFMFLGFGSEKQVVPLFGDFSPTSKVALAGVLPGDRLLEIDGKQVRYLQEHDLYVFNQVLKGKSIRLLVDSQLGHREFTLETADIPIYKIDPVSLMRQLGLVPIAPPGSTIVGRVLENSVADLAGLQKGDRFVLIDGKPIKKWQDLSAVVIPSANKSLPFVIDRDGVELRLTITPQETTVGDKKVGRIGVGGVRSPYPEEQLVNFSRTPLEAVNYGIYKTWVMSSVTIRMLWKMVTLKVSHKNISGPITIADVAGQAIQINWQSYLSVLAFISISLGVMNLLPIPMLDGGHLMMYVVEAVAGKAAADYNDIFRLLN